MTSARRSLMKRPLPHATLAAVAAVAVAVVVAVAVAPPAGAAPAYTTIPVTGCCAIDEVEAAGGLVVLETDNRTGRVERIDPVTGAVTATLPLPAPPNGDGYFDFSDLTVADGSVWLAIYWTNAVYRLDPMTLQIQATIPTGTSPSGLV